MGDRLSERDDGPMGGRRSEHDDGRQHGSADRKAWQRIYRGDSGAGLANPNDDEGNDDEGDR